MYLNSTIPHSLSKISAAKKYLLMGHPKERSCVTGQMVTQQLKLCMLAFGQEVKEEASASY